MDLDVKQMAVHSAALAEEKNLPEEVVQDAIRQALAAAFRRDFGDREQDVRVDVNFNTGDMVAYVSREVVETVEDDALQVSEADAQKIKKGAKVGDVVEERHEVKTFGRVAAQTAKQVILQRLREAEREIIMEEYQDKIGTVINGVVSRVEGRLVRVDIGRAQGIMPQSEQIRDERYYPGQRIKVYLKDVEKGFRGPQLIVSRGNVEFMTHLFRAEVPEMDNGAVEIKGLVREAGVRSKVAVASTVQGVDPVGTFVGGHGTRVNAVMGEVGEQEKIDIIIYDEDTTQYIINALSPTKVTRVELSESDKKAKVVVPDDQQSIAIGKSGQNVRLASKLTGYDIDIVPESEAGGAKPEPAAKPAEGEKAAPRPRLKRKEQLESSLLDAIEEHGEES